jgi:excisionase family DNA binding protein
MADINSTRNMLKATEVAQLLNVHINTVRRWSNQNIIKTYRVGPRGDRRFRKADVDLFLNENGKYRRKYE